MSKFATRKKAGKYKPTRKHPANTLNSKNILHDMEWAVVKGGPEMWQVFTWLPKEPNAIRELLGWPCLLDGKSYMQWLDLQINTLNMCIRPADRDRFQRQRDSVMRLRTYLYMVLTGTLTPEEAQKAGSLADKLAAGV